MHSAYSLGGIEAQDPQAFNNLLSLIETIEAHDEHPDPSGESDLRELFANPHFEVASDLVVAWHDETMAGWIAAVHRPSTERLVGVNLRGGVHPAHRTNGVGSALLTWAEARGRAQMLTADPSLPRWIAASAFESHGLLRKLLAGQGFEERRWFVDMKRPLDEPPDLRSPDGISIVPWADQYADQVRAVHAAAFADHWGSTGFDEATWQNILAAEGTRLDLSFVALDGDVVVGYSFNEAWPSDEDDDHDDERIAWVGSLGTLRDYRRRGIASSLLDHSHARFQQAGFTHAMLDVDADSPTNAGSIYRAHGYEPVYREVVAVKEYRA